MLRQIPSYKEILFAVDPGSSFTLNRIGDVIAFLDVLGGPFTMAIDEGEESDVRAGIAYKMPNGAEFKRLFFRDTGLAGGTIRIAIARGDIRDARSTITGSFPVQNAAPPFDFLQTKLAATDAGLAALAIAINGRIDTITSQQSDPTQKRANLTSLAGCTFREGTNATDSTGTEVVSAAANVNGIWIPRAMVQSGASNAESTLKINAGANIIAGFKAGTIASGISLIDVVTNLFIPSGVNLVSMTGGNTSNRNWLWYKVL